MMKNRNPIYFERKILQPHEKLYLIHDKYVLANENALDKCGPHSKGNDFVFNIDFHYKRL